MFGPDFERAVRIWMAVVLTIVFVAGAVAVETVRALATLLGWRPS